ncbi:integrase, catalytic region, zinc finger, CCHC-type containing protein [Tanacetum coccineum]
MKAKSVETKFEKSSVIRQPNAFKSQRQSILGKPAIFSDSLTKKDFSKSKSVTTQNVSHDFSKPVTAQILPQNVLPIVKNTNVIAPGMYKLVKILLFIVDSRCSKHMTGNLKLLTNFVEKFLGTVKFGNDQIDHILGYGDLVQGAITIKRVYYVEGLNHNLFFVGQFCDADLKVAFQKVLLSKDETPGVLIDFLTLVQRGLHAQVTTVRTDKGTKFLNKTLHAFFLKEGIRHKTSTARTPEQNSVVERRNRTLVEAA